MKHLVALSVTLCLSLPLMAQTNIIDMVRDLPLLPAPGTDIRYEGSIDKTGGNADWDWYLYEDENHEWVVLDVDGPGCIENLTQHRYFTASDPLFRFYLDGAATPQYEVRLSEIGLKFPFMKPLADCYIGPYDNGRGPIRVARSFVPLRFTTHCKVTTDVKLYGNDLQHGLSGWGHIVYHTYAQPQGATSAYRNENLEESRLLASHGLVALAADVREQVAVAGRSLLPGEEILLAQSSGQGTVAAVRLFAQQIDSTFLQSVWIAATFDGHATPDVLCPIGAFFGNSIGLNDSQYLLMGVTTTGTLYNTFPMPFWESARLTLVNNGGRPFPLSGGVVTLASNDYPQANTGYYRNTPFYSRKHTEGADSRIASATGRGRMVAAHISCWAQKPHTISCEGDVHLYIDHENTPRLQSDGSESYVSYGWGFPTPSESHPFGGYDGLSDNPWSMTRLCILDHYPFHSSLAFNIESGEHNNQYLEHSGTVFYYGKDTPGELLTDSVFLSDRTSCRRHHLHIKGPHALREATSVYEGTHNHTAISGRYMTYGEGAVTSFRASIHPDNDGIRLLRTSNQQRQRQRAEVYVDGIRIKERCWYHVSSNEHMQWLDDSFVIPSAYTKGKREILIEIRPLPVDDVVSWTDVAYRIYTYQRM